MTTVTDHGGSHSDDSFCAILLLCSNRNLQWPLTGPFCNLSSVFKFSGEFLLIFVSVKNMPNGTRETVNLPDALLGTVSKNW